MHLKHKTSRNKQQREQKKLHNHYNRTGARKHLRHQQQPSAKKRASYRNILFNRKNNRSISSCRIMHISNVSIWFLPCKKKKQNPHKKKITESYIFWLSAFNVIQLNICVCHVTYSFIISSACYIDLQFTHILFCPVVLLSYKTH